MGIASAILIQLGPDGVWIWLTSLISQFWLAFSPGLAGHRPKFSTNSVLVLDNGIAVSLKDHNGAELSDSNFYGKESSSRMRGKKKLMTSNLS